MSYQAMYSLAVLVGLLIALFTGIANVDPQTLGLTVIAHNWAQIALGPLGFLALLLPSLRRPPNDERNGRD